MSILDSINRFITLFLDGDEQEAEILRGLDPAVLEEVQRLHE